MILETTYRRYYGFVDCSGYIFGKNEQVRKVFWTLFIALGGLVLARVVDPVTAQQIVGMITGMGM